MMVLEAYHDGGAKARMCGTGTGIVCDEAEWVNQDPSD